MAQLTEPGALRLSPVLIRRRCRVAASAVLPGLGSDELWLAAREFDEAAGRCRLLGNALADRIAELVPTVSADERRLLLRAKRDAFNARPLSGTPAVDGVAAYRLAVAERDRCAEALDRRSAELAAATPAALRAALADPDVAASVEMSVPGLVLAARDGLGTASARARRRTLTLLRLVQRAATKPSPFARLTDSTVLLPGATDRPPRGHVRVDRRTVDWVRRWVRASGPAALPAGRVLLTTNPSATPADGRVSWLAGGGVRSAGCPDGLAAMLVRLRTPTPLADLAPDGAVPPVLRQLIDCGLVEAGPRLPGWGRRTLATAAEVVGTETGAAREIRDALLALQEIEAHPAGPVTAAHARDRADAAGTGVRRLAAACGLKDDGTDRLLLTEDLVGVAASEGPRPTRRMLADLARVQAIAPLLGAELPFQLAAAVCFRDRFGEASVPLLTAFRWFAESGRQSADRMVAESTEPVLAEVLGLRSELTAGLAKLAAGTDGTGTVACDGDWLAELAAALPGAVAEWTNVAWPVQWAGELLVLNGISVGFGRFAARIAGTLDETELARLREEIAAAVPPDVVPVDIAARFGATANEHPPLLPAALAYPGSALECEPATRVDLSTITLHVAAGRLLASSTDFPGRTVLPVPHNATLPSIAPTLFRWLSRLGPSQGSTLALWDIVDAAAARTGIRHYPRLTLGELVLCRQTWKVPDAELPADDDVLSWRRWAERTGVPRRTFVRGTTLPEPWDVLRGLASDHHVQAARARTGGAVRKPAYVDLSQPLGRPHRGTAPGETLTFTEPLPDPLPEPPAAEAGEHVAEYVLETARPFHPRRTP
ncbi:lantibiotic dehydratase [Amycolatopsis sp. NBC_01480]|uniref:lantibiotic dehydratase n=1 Tax=Amycolatopsis sp. NBC_01480 TaxID=2903562 RepID=UPI002E2D689A|nr:lantibiotic dehydratase [Amycolatopsis sp. NBC_01480]